MNSTNVLGMIPYKVWKKILAYQICSSSQSASKAYHCAKILVHLSKDFVADDLRGPADLRRGAAGSCADQQEQEAFLSYAVPNSLLFVSL